MLIPPERVLGGIGLIRRSLPGVSRDWYGGFSTPTYAVMPLDVLGRTRATLTEPTSSSPWPKGLGNLVKLCRAGDRALQLLLFNEEFLVSASHQLALITSLPFVHTARRYYRLNDRSEVFGLDARGASPPGDRVVARPGR